MQLFYVASELASTPSQNTHLFSHAFFFFLFNLNKTSTTFSDGNQTFNLQASRLITVFVRFWSLHLYSHFLFFFFLVLESVCVCLYCCESICENVFELNWKYSTNQIKKMLLTKVLLWSGSPSFPYNAFEIWKLYGCVPLK